MIRPDAPSGNNFMLTWKVYGWQGASNLYKRSRSILTRKTRPPLLGQQGRHALLHGRVSDQPSAAMAVAIKVEGGVAGRIAEARICGHG